MTQATAAPVLSGIFQSRWGYHPCSYADYRVICRLFGHYLKAVRAYHAWCRWARKLPHNRVRWEAIRDGQNRRVGWEKMGTQPVPKQCMVFVGRLPRTRFDHRKPWVPDRVDDLGIIKALQECRPVAGAEGVLPLAEERLAYWRGLLARLEQHV